MLRLLLVFALLVSAMTSIEARVSRGQNVYRQHNFKFKKKKKGKKKKKDKGNKRNTGGSYQYDVIAKLASCKSGDDVLTASPMNLEDITSILPLGNLNSTAHTFPTRHMYFHIRRQVDADFSTPPAMVPVYAPADIRINTINRNKFSGDYVAIDMKFSLCKELLGYFDHITSLSDELQAKFDAKNNCKNLKTGDIGGFNRCQAIVDIEIKAGDYIGTAGGDNYNSALDLGLFDKRVESIEFANMSRWKDDDPLHPYFKTVCPIDYYTEDLKANLEAKIGYYGLERNAEPICGTVNYDVAGTASGMWFVAGEYYPYPEDPHLALVHDTLKTELGIFSVGTSFKQSIDTSLYYFLPEDSGLVNRDFDQVTHDTNTYCYEVHPGGSNASYDEGVTKVIYLKLLDKDTLRIEGQGEAGCGSGPWEFGSDYIDVDR